MHATWRQLCAVPGSRLAAGWSVRSGVNLCFAVQQTFARSDAGRRDEFCRYNDVRNVHDDFIRLVAIKVAADATRCALKLAVHGKRGRRSWSIPSQPHSTTVSNDFNTVYWSPHNVHRSMGSWHRVRGSDLPASNMDRVFDQIDWVAHARNCKRELFQAWLLCAKASNVVAESVGGVEFVLVVDQLGPTQPRLARNVVFADAPVDLRPVESNVFDRAEDAA